MSLGDESPKPHRPTLLFADQFSELAGGAQRTMVELLSALDGCYSAVVAIPGRGSFSSELERRGIRSEIIPVGDYARGSKSVVDLLRYAARQPMLTLRLVQLARSVNAALLCANGPRLFPATALAAHWCNIPLLWRLPIELDSARDRWVAERFARLARPTIIACSHACLAPFSDRSPIRRDAAVIYTGVQRVNLPSGPDQRDPLGWPVIGTVGTLHPVKGQADLLRAAPRVLRSFPNACFRFVGVEADASYVRHLREQAEIIGSERVEFCGPADSPAEAFAGLDVLAVPSRRESLGRVILEAFSAGIPVAASAIGGITEIVEQRRTGLLFPSGEPDRLAAALLELLSNESLRETIVREARQCYELQWREERFHEEMTVKVRSLIEPHRPDNPRIGNG